MATGAVKRAARTRTLAPEIFGEPRFVFHGVTWDEYESVMRWVGDRRIPVTYDRGTLQVASPLPSHEKLKILLSSIVEILLEELDLEGDGLGSTTFRRRDLDRGLEPESSYYIKNLMAVYGKRTLDLRVDPAPDLVIEVDITSSSIDRLAIYAAFGVPEVWHWKDERLRILRLRGGSYTAAAKSANFAGFESKSLTDWASRGMRGGQTSWRKAFREWVRGEVARGKRGRRGKRK